ncbi:MAG TPA: acyl-CoA dehydrogenase family protein [Leptolyngbyaceae cyanobacterium M33_DOE_097]|uniref:Acyl-CoA dehydrogenase n=1 Tax=Oscillatoriales cyanobacterium SpSt-418 TaxID=2282169 RepID=A0A7C3PLQ5_9CYAN|nr:acyl-CoA dehydrogenase family protein [Leptolyngbyaceae cyanobacterium M33_DOE_097]
MLELKPPIAQQSTQPWIERAHELGLQFSERSINANKNDQFVAENFADLRQYGFVSAAVPIEFGGGGASYTEMSEVLRELAHHCSSTALAFAMHTHQVIIPTWRWQHQGAPVEGLLRRIAMEQIILLSSGGSDWLESSGTATRVEGGFRINGYKAFASGAPAGNLLMTSAVYDDPEMGATVLHFAVPVQAEGVKIDPVWYAMGMQGTGSHNVVLTDVFIPDAGIALRRPQGKWHPLFHIISMLAIPLIYSVYVGVAEAARDLAVRVIQKRPANNQIAYLVGGIENELMAARLALQNMVTIAETSQPGFETTNQVMMGRTLAARAVLNVVDLAMEAMGGSAFYRSVGLEQLFRDAQAARYHPLRESAQRRLAGQLALDWPIEAND